MQLKSLLEQVAAPLSERASRFDTTPPLLQRVARTRAHGDDVVEFTRQSLPLAMVERAARLRRNLVDDHSSWRSPETCHTGVNLFSLQGRRGRSPAQARKDDKMHGLWSSDMWGTPVGLGIFLLCLGVGMGVFFWGVSKLPAKKD